MEGIVAFLGLSLALPIILAPVAFWIWLLVDCLQNEPQGSTQKLAWALVILFGQIPGAVIYYFFGRAPRVRARALATTPLPTPEEHAQLKNALAWRTDERAALPTTSSPPGTPPTPDENARLKSPLAWRTNKAG
ncbi:MAG TPA: PLD nuclease N-terminal domain-containing protein [Thermoanaerobaculia bacterium]|jgi:hypothetical protein|nr:PLD nuclease N-terminal domain-containing protein [Thermoanaerobaculia bacterium]